MEKKIKKLQLKKETVAVLNGEKMSNIIGGNGINPCINGGYFDGVKCHCPPDFEGQFCETPIEGESYSCNSCISCHSCIKCG